MISLIAAVADNNVIGTKGGLPWHLPADFAWFKATTKNKCVLMGRKTFESLGRPLPQRLNIVISRTPQAATANVIWTDSLKAALAIAKDHHTTHGPEIMVIGGGDIYAQALPLADRLYLTEVACAPDNGDTFFPDFDKHQWQKTLVTEHPAQEQQPAFVIAQYDRL